MATLVQLQEQALQLEIDIYGKDGKELTAKQLQKLIAAKAGDNAANAQLEADANEIARATAREEETAVVEAERAEVARKVATNSVVELSPDQLKAYKLPAYTKADIALAKQHGYPVAVPGAEAYRIKVSLNCAYGGGLREMGSVMLLTPEHAANKTEYLTAV